MTNNILESKLIAHRGLHNDSIKENTIYAFKNALSHKLPIELDIHILKDNTLIVFHDHNLKRLYKKDIDIRNLNYKKISKLTDYEIPKLEEVLKLVDGKVPLLIEIKKDSKKYNLEKELVILLDEYKGDFAVQSFNIKSILWFKKHRPDYIRGLLFHNKIKPVDRLNEFISIKKTKPNFISVNFNLLNKRYIRRYNKDMKIMSWTIKNDENYDKYKDLCDTLICEKIDILERNKR